jgi:type I restriction enzyme S subunit
LQSEYSNVYTYNFLTLKKNWIVAKYIQGGQGNLSGDIVKSISIPFPKRAEQQKIASCLSSLDEVISAHSQKLELLKDHKKGLMQNLFPQEGEKVPKYHFPEFENDGEWTEETIGGVYDFKVTNSLSREFLNYEKGEVKNIHYGDIHMKFNTLFDITKECVPFINEDVPFEKIKKENYCIEGDIVFADASEDLNDVGKSIEIVNLNNEKLVSGLHTLLGRQRERTIEIGFGGYLFKSDWVRKQIQREAQGAKVLGISATRISNVKISYPKNPKEQKKIASCLSALDELITAQTEKTEQLKLHKKGLMQRLFPKVEN